METATIRWARRGAELLALSLGLWQMAVVGQAMSKRWDYDFDIEWMEGGTLLSAMRVAEGQPIHGPPTTEYIPFIYPPLYAWLVGLLGQVFPMGYALGRGTSIACFSLAALALLYGARQAKASWPVAIALMGVFAGTYDEAGTFYDLIRVDSLTIALLGWALVLGAGPKPWQQVLSGLLLAGAFMAKHNAAAFGLPMIIGIWQMQGRAAALRFGAASVLPALAFVAIEEVATGGHFLAWILGVPAEHGIVGERLISGLGLKLEPRLRLPTRGAQLEFWDALPVTTTLALLAPAWFRRHSNALYWSGISAMGVVICSLMRGHVGGFINVLIPMYWILCLWPVLQAEVLEQRWGTAEAGRFFSRVPAWTVRILLPLCLAGQLWVGHKDLKRYIPTEANRKAAAAFIEEIRALPDPILSPYAPYALVQAGKDPTFSLICLWDIDYKGGPYRPFVRKVERGIAQQKWAVILAPNDKLGYGQKKHYTKERMVKNAPPETIVGWRVRLNQIWVPLAGAGVGENEPAEEENTEVDEAGGPVEPSAD